LFWILVRLYLSDDCQVSGYFEAGIVWNSENGHITPVVPLYLPSIIAVYLISNLEEEKRNNLTNYLSTKSDDFDSRDLTPLIDLFVGVLSYKFRDTAYFEENPPPHILDDLHPLSNPAHKWDISLLTLKVPNEYKIESGIIDDKQGFIELKWSGYNQGRIRLEFSLEIRKTTCRNQEPQQDYVDILNLTPIPEIEGIDWGLDESKFFIAAFHVSFTGKFSPVRGLFRRFDIEQLIAWTKHSLDTLTSEFDWQNYSSTQIQLRQGLRHGRDIGFELDLWE
jgi:hypothetical protein